MVTSFVLRLVADGLLRGEFSGEVHHVESGRRVVVRTREELLEALCEPVRNRAEGHS